MEATDESSLEVFLKIEKSVNQQQILKTFNPALKGIKCCCYRSLLVLTTHEKFKANLEICKTWKIIFINNPCQRYVADASWWNRETCEFIYLLIKWTINNWIREPYILQSEYGLSGNKKLRVRNLLSFSTAELNIFPTKSIISEPVISRYERKARVAKNRNR